MEYQLDGISQIQTHEEIGMTFSSALRSILRHDPDVVLIGEIRDLETAEIAIRAAQTGHLVFSTLHTNDSVSTITRLIEMGIEPFLVGSSLVCSIAQRLARRICRNCQKEVIDIPTPLRTEIATSIGLPLEAVRAWHGTGCVECNQHGFRGRVAIYEFFILTDEIADILTPQVTTGQLRATALRQGWKSLRTQAFLKVQSGLVSLDEMQRLTQRVSDYPVLRKT